MKRRNLIFLGLIIILFIEGNMRPFLGDGLILVMILSILMALFLILKKNTLLMTSYIITLLIILLFREETRGANVSFDTFKRWAPLIFSNKTVFINIVGNILIYLPMGIIFSKYLNLFKTIAYANVFIIGIEIIQLVFRLGIFDVLDIILNILGVLVGFISYRLWSWYLWRRRMMMD